jgi:hypothetical protein
MIHEPSIPLSLDAAEVWLTRARTVLHATNAHLRSAEASRNLLRALELVVMVLRNPPAPPVTIPKGCHKIEWSQRLLTANTVVDFHGICVRRRAEVFAAIRDGGAVDHALSEYAGAIAARTSNDLALQQMKATDVKETEHT